MVNAIVLPLLGVGAYLLFVLSVLVVDANWWISGPIITILSVLALVLGFRFRRELAREAGRPPANGSPSPRMAFAWTLVGLAVPAVAWGGLNCNARLKDVPWSLELAQSELAHLEQEQKKNQDLQDLYLRQRDERVVKLRKEISYLKVVPVLCWLGIALSALLGIGAVAIWMVLRTSSPESPQGSG